VTLQSSAGSPLDPTELHSPFGVSALVSGSEHTGGTSTQFTKWVLYFSCSTPHMQGLTQYDRSGNERKLAMAITQRIHTSLEFGYGYDTDIPANLAARILGTAPATTRKAVRAGIIPSPNTFEVVSKLADTPVVESVLLDGKPVPVLRLGELQQSSDPDRDNIGYHSRMSNDAFTASCDRWWPKIEMVSAAGGLLVAHGGWLVGAFSIGTDPREIDDTGKVWYDAALIARCRDAYAGHIEVEEGTEGHPMAEIARRVLGGRVFGGQGGSFTRLSGDQSQV
jgi:hypothetical protein